MKKTYVFENDEATAYGSVISVYGPGSELMADYVKEPGQLGTTRKVTMDYILGGEAIAKRIVSEVSSEDGSSSVSITTKYLQWYGNCGNTGGSGGGGGNSGGAVGVISSASGGGNGSYTFTPESAPSYLKNFVKTANETLINSLCGRIAIAYMPRGARNLNIFLYMPRFLRSVRKSAYRQTLHIIFNFPHSELISVSLIVFPKKSI